MASSGGGGRYGGGPGGGGYGGGGPGYGGGGPARRVDVVAGIDRGLAALMDTERTRPRKAVDSSPHYVTLGEARAFRRPDGRDGGGGAAGRGALTPPHSSFAKLMTPSADSPADAPGAFCTRHWHTGVTKTRGPVRVALYKPDGRKLLTSSGPELIVWHAETGTFDTIHPGGPGAHEYRVTAAAWTGDGEHLLAGDEGGSVVFWSTSLAVDEKFQAHPERVPVHALALAPGDRKFATAGEDGRVRVFDFWRQALEHECAMPAGAAHTNAAASVAWHPFSALLASGGRDAAVRLWDARSGAPLRTLGGHTSGVAAVRWNANGWWLASGSRDNTVRVHDTRFLREPFAALAVDGRGVTALAWHPFCERALVAGTMSGGLFWWGVEDAGGAPPATADVPRAHDKAVQDVAFSPSGGVLASGSDDCTTKFWARGKPGDTALQYAYGGNERRNNFLAAQLAAGGAGGGVGGAGAGAGAGPRAGAGVGVGVGVGGAAIASAGGGDAAAALQARSFAELQAAAAAQRAAAAAADGGRAAAAAAAGASAHRWGDAGAVGAGAGAAPSAGAGAAGAAGGGGPLLPPPGAPPAASHFYGGGGGGGYGGAAGAAGGAGGAGWESTAYAASPTRGGADAGGGADAAGGGAPRAYAYGAGEDEEEDWGGGGEGFEGFDDMGGDGEAWAAGRGGVGGGAGGGGAWGAGAGAYAGAFAGAGPGGGGGAWGGGAAGAAVPAGPAGGGWGAGQPAAAAGGGGWGGAYAYGGAGGPPLAGAPLPPAGAPPGAYGVGGAPQAYRPPQ